VVLGDAGTRLAYRVSGKLARLAMRFGPCAAFPETVGRSAATLPCRGARTFAVFGRKWRAQVHLRTTSQRDHGAAGSRALLNDIHEPCSMKDILSRRPLCVTRGDAAPARADRVASLAARW